MNQKTDSTAAGGRAFPSTHWSLLLAAPGDSLAMRKAFDALARRYWRPVVAYARALQAQSEDAAEEAAQEFFLWMLERGFLARADPERGSFRGFVKRSLANFLHDLERKRRTVKRGGARKLLSLDDLHDGDAEPLPDPAGRDPEAWLDELWRKELLARATDELEAELRDRDKLQTFAVFRDYYLSDEELDHESLAARHGISTMDVSNRLTFAKKRYRAHLRAAVLETVQSDEDLRAELAWLFEDSEA